MAELLLVLGADRLFYRGPPVDGGAHRHHAIQLAAGLGAPLQLCGDDGRVQEGMGALVAADARHRLLGGAPQIALLYLEPEGATAQALVRQRGLDHAPLQTFAPAPELSARLASFGADEDFDALCADWLAALGVAPATPAPAMDARVAAVIAHLRAHLEQRHAAAALGRYVGLSAHRLMHLFRDSTGLPLRRYALWLRLRTALAAALKGASLTEAAHAAGFSDSAHLSRSFREHFGLPPRFLFEQRGRLTVRFR